MSEWDGFMNAMDALKANAQRRGLKFGGVQMSGLSPFNAPLNDAPHGIAADPSWWLSQDGPDYGVAPSDRVPRALAQSALVRAANARWMHQQQGGY
jgi:hypothetical protein